jgi:hypothetical protein
MIVFLCFKLFVFPILLFLRVKYDTILPHFLVTTTETCVCMKKNITTEFQYNSLADDRC